MMEQRNWSQGIEDQTSEGLGRTKQLAIEAKAAVDVWHRRVTEAENAGASGDADLMFCDDMLADAQDWLQACSWIFKEAQAELGAGRPGRFCELGSTLAEEVDAGAVEMDLLVYIWAVVGEPPDAAGNSGQDSKVVGADEADVEAVAEEANADAVDAKANVEGAAEETEAEAEAVAGSTVTSRAGAANRIALDDQLNFVRDVLGEPLEMGVDTTVADRLAQQRPGLDQEGTIHLEQLGTVGARVSIVVGSLWWARQGYKQEGTLHLGWPGGGCRGCIM